MHAPCAYGPEAEFLTPHLKLGQNGIVSFPIRLAVFQARGGARMKLHRVRTANRRISNIEPQIVEGWNRFAQSFLK
jgi:hypothetical protein